MAVCEQDAVRQSCWFAPASTHRTARYIRMHHSLGGVPELGTHSMALCLAGEDSQMSRRRDHEWGLWTSTTLPLDYGTSLISGRALAAVICQYCRGPVCCKARRTDCRQSLQVFSTRTYMTAPCVTSTTALKRVLTRRGSTCSP